MGDVTHVEIGEIDAIEGFFEGITFHRAAAGLGVSSFGISIIELAPGANDYPEHDHSEDGIGGQMFAKRPQQLGQEEVRLTTPAARCDLSPGLVARALLDSGHGFS